MCIRDSIRSDLKITSESGSKSANSLGVDVSAFYQGQEFRFTNNNKGLFRFGINISKFNIDFTQTVKRSREVSHRLSKGIEFLIKKNKIKHIDGTGVLKSKSEISVLKGDKKQKIKAKKIIIATGGRPKEFPGIKYDGKRLITSKEAMTCLLYTSDAADE